MTIPEGFWWGTGASSTQCEGAAPRSDWARWEQLERVPRSGDGNGFAGRYRDDFAQYAEHGLTHHRLSLEWARLEPEEGRHDLGEVERYRAILEAGRDAGLAMWVCLHHFTLPGWFSEDLGGFDDERNRLRWARHVDWVAETFGDLVFGWKPINEPMAFAATGWLLGMHPPGRTDLGDFHRMLEAMLLAQHEAWRLLRSGDQPTATILNLSPRYPGVRSRDPGEREAAQQMTASYDAVTWNCWIRALRDGLVDIPGRPQREIPDMAGSFDLVGFSYYSADTVFADGTTGPYPADARVGPLGYAPWSEGLGIVLRRLAEELPGRALLVCEHGVGTTDDEWRTHVLRESLIELERAIDDGVDVRGFFHWTGTDNYEWGHGFEVPFGLFDRDRQAKGSAALAREWATR